MKPINWEQVYQKWMGTAAELAAVAEEVIVIVGMKDPEVQPNERLIRHYVQRGVLNRPIRKGRLSLFGFQQIAQYLVARNLALDGWPLAKIAKFTTASDLSGLLDLIPKVSRNENASVTNKFAELEQKEMGDKGRQDDKTGHQQHLNFSDKIRPKQIVEIKLSPWCKIHIDKNMIRSIQPEEADWIGKKITNILKNKEN